MASPGDNGRQVVRGEQPHAAAEMGPIAYDGPTVKYEVNKTYHVTIHYDDDQKTTSMKVKDWLTRTVDWQ